MPETRIDVDLRWRARAIGLHHASRMLSLSPTSTAVGVAALRALYTNMPGPLGFVSDQLAARLLPRPLGALTTVVRGRPVLARAVHNALRLLTGDLSLSAPLRTIAIDQELQPALDRGATQLVLLGSGLDSRAWRCPELRACSVFELDRAASHRHKLARLRSTPALARSHEFVPIDFERESIAQALQSAGHQSAIPTLWIWEGVLIYLPRAAIRSTLEQLSAVSCAGSTLIATYTRPGFGARRFPTFHLRLAARVVGEPVRGEIDSPALHAILRDFGWAVASDEAVSRWAHGILPQGARGPEWERLVVAIRGR